MGNCLVSRGSSTMLWDEEDGEEWDYYDRRCHEQKKCENAPMLKGSPTTTTCCATADAGCKGTEVKVKITKKQLEEMLGRASVEGLSTEEVLLQLIKSNGVHHACDEVRQRTWRPALHSIPEVNSI